MNLKSRHKRISGTIINPSNSALRQLGRVRLPSLRGQTSRKSRKIFLKEGMLIGPSHPLYFKLEKRLCDDLPGHEDPKTIRFKERNGAVHYLTFRKSARAGTNYYKVIMISRN
jgi:hypothetical protein